MKAFSRTVAGVALMGLLAACGGMKPVVYMESYAPEESSLNLVKITDEATNSVVAGGSFRPNAYTNYALTSQGICGKQGFAWNTHNVLDISPDGSQLAYCTRMNGQDNIMVRSTGAQGMSTQRTFRNVHSFSWGVDGKLYFSDINGDNLYVCSVNAQSGSLMNQLTNGSVSDVSPVLSPDQKLVFFTRLSSSGPSIWSLNRENGTQTSCARGYSPCLIKGNPDAFYCVRNSTSGRSEIWYVDYGEGPGEPYSFRRKQELHQSQAVARRQVVVCVGNSVSNISNKDNLDIFVVRTDGTRLTQLTFHPQADTSPVWAADGRSIYFVSSRANENNSYNVWRMNFNLE